MDDWSRASVLSILEGARSFAEKVRNEHQWPCHCRRCAEAVYTAASLRVVMESAPELTKEDLG